MLDALGQTMGWDVVALWHKEGSAPSDLDVIALPGGFSYGDYLRAGAIARFSPVMGAVAQFAARGGYVFGVCNGFQILTEMKLLPGALRRNRSLRFRCVDVYLRHEPGSRTLADLPEQILRLPIAHGEGAYTTDDDGLKRLEDRGQVLFRYCDAEGNVTDASNANGSAGSIAGICNQAGNVFGMMPHPERAVLHELGGQDGRLIFASIERALSAPAAAR